MTREKILEVIAMYRERFVTEGIKPEKMDPKAVFSSDPAEARRQQLSHAHHLCAGIEEYSADPEKVGKTGRHLGSLQTLLWCAGWYTLEELMNHNRP